MSDGRPMWITVTFEGLGFCCQKFSKEVMALENKRAGTEDSVGATLPRR